MSKVLDLLNLLTLETIEDGLYRGQSQDLGFGAVFGGQVIGQALSAAKKHCQCVLLISQLFMSGRCKETHCL